jgi:hypothetical protein
LFFSGAVVAWWTVYSSQAGTPTMNEERYEEVLDSHLLPFMTIHGSTCFLQDGALCHASKRINPFRSEQPFLVIDWPGNTVVLTSTQLKIAGT